MNECGQIEPLAYAPAPPAERRTALVTLGGLGLFAIVGIRFGSQILGHNDALVPTANAASFVALLVSATILRNQYRTSRFAPFAFLAVGFVLTALLLIPYTLAFPHAFSPNAFGLDPQAQVWLWVLWHATFVLGVAAYVWSESFSSRKAAESKYVQRYLRAYALASTTVVAILASAILRYAHSLPALMGPAGATPVFQSLVRVLLASCATVLVALAIRTRFRHTIHLWLGLIVTTLAIEVSMRGELSVRTFSIAWYAGLLEGLAWQILFLTSQLRHENEQLAAYASDKRELIETTLRDQLTGCLNRRGFDTRLADALARCRLARSPIAILTLDLDHFKAYNDHFGHLAGDEALRAVGGAISGIANRSSDACCRIGGEEFAIVLAMTDCAGAQTVAERLREAVIRLRIAHAPEASHAILTVSVGYAVADGTSAVDARALYEAADRALYRAKSLGRNRIAGYERPIEAPLRAV